MSDHEGNTFNSLSRDHEVIDDSATVKVWYGDRLSTPSLGITRAWALRGTSYTKR
jgi:hypothetical protein